MRFHRPTDRQAPPAPAPAPPQQGNKDLKYEIALQVPDGMIQANPPRASGGGGGGGGNIGAPGTPPPHDPRFDPLPPIKFDDDIELKDDRKSKKEAREALRRLEAASENIESFMHARPTLKGYLRDSFASIIEAIEGAKRGDYRSFRQAMAQLKQESGGIREAMRRANIPSDVVTEAIAAVGEAHASLQTIHARVQNKHSAEKAKRKVLGALDHEIEMAATAVGSPMLGGHKVTAEELAAARDAIKAGVDPHQVAKSSSEGLRSLFDQHKFGEGHERDPDADERDGTLREIATGKGPLNDWAKEEDDGDASPPGIPKPPPSLFDDDERVREAKEAVVRVHDEHVDRMEAGGDRYIRPGLAAWARRNKQRSTEEQKSAEEKNAPKPPKPRASKSKSSGSGWDESLHPRDDDSGEFIEK